MRAQAGNLFVGRVFGGVESLKRTQYNKYRANCNIERTSGGFWGRERRKDVTGGKVMILPFLTENAPMSLVQYSRLRANNVNVVQILMHRQLPTRKPPVHPPCYLPV